MELAGAEENFETLPEVDVYICIKELTTDFVKYLKLLEWLLLNFLDKKDFFKLSLLRRKSVLNFLLDLSRRLNEGFAAAVPVLSFEREDFESNIF